MCINEAGVAGAVLWPLCMAIMAGEAVREPGLGGGRISDNMGSGEIESVSEVSRVAPEADCIARASCMSSETSLGISEEMVAFRLFGLTMGDCRTRVLGLAVRGGARLLVLRSFLLGSCGIMAGSPSMSMSMSMGECPVELPDGVCCMCWGACWLTWAVSAGDVSGLK